MLRVSADRKLKTKSDIIATIAQAQQVYQQWPRHLQYQKLHTYYTSRPQQVLYNAQQATFHGDHHHSLNKPLQSRNASAESTSTPTPASSPTISVMSDFVSLD